MEQRTKLFQVMLFLYSDYLRPEGRRLKQEFRGRLGFSFMVFGLRVVAVSMRDGRLGVGGPVILEDVLVCGLTGHS